MPSPSRTYKLSPSDFAFLWEDCKRCFYLKVVHGIDPPSIPMAAVFKRLEGLQEDHFRDRRTSEIAPDLPAGTIRTGERWVESKQIDSDRGTGASGYIVGKLDALIEFDDGSWGVIDFKTTATRDEKVRLYSRQLHAYALSLIRPAESPRRLRGPALALSPVTRLGLICFEPQSMRETDDGQHAYLGPTAWIEVPIDWDAFRDFFEEILDLIAGPVPEPDRECRWCLYSLDLGATGLGPAVADGDRERVCPDCGSRMRTRRGRRGPFLSCTRYPECRATRPA